jgi:hypothetical protein
MRIIPAAFLYLWDACFTGARKITLFFLFSNRVFAAFPNKGGSRELVTVRPVKAYIAAGNETYRLNPYGFVIYLQTSTLLFEINCKT